MYKIKKTFEIAAAHCLKLKYPSKCSSLHGHDFYITVYAASRKLNEEGMVIDFTQIKQKIQGILDHKILNEIVDVVQGDHLGETKNPTSEVLAEWICHQFPECYRVDVQESKGNVATYYDDDFWVKFYDV